LIDACIICTGLYLVAWGKSKDYKKNPSNPSLDEKPTAEPTKGEGEMDLPYKHKKSRT